MVKEVSCRVLEEYFDIARRRNIPLETLCDGVPYELPVLRNKNERIEWNVFCRMTANLRPFLSESDFEEIGAKGIASGSLRIAFSLVGRLLFTCSEFYRWANEGAGPELFKCVSSSVQQVDKNRLVISLKLAPGRQHCREFFLSVKGSLRAMSTVMGLPPADVEMREIDRGVSFLVVHADGGGSLSWLRKAVTAPFAGRRVARELKEANEVLLERYAQLEEAQASIQQNALELERMRLRIADDLHDEIGSELSAIALESDLVARQLPVQNPQHLRLRAIAAAIRGAAEDLRDVVWIVNPEEDSVLDLTTRMRSVIGKMLPGMEVRFHAEAGLRDISLEMEFKRHVFLMFKEILHNISKHAQATLVEVSMDLRGDVLHLRIADNGVGFDADARTDGHGLGSLRSRAKKIGGTVVIERTEGGGTTVHCSGRITRS